MKQVVIEIYRGLTAGVPTASPSGSGRHRRSGRGYCV